MKHYFRDIGRVGVILYMFRLFSFYRKSSYIQLCVNTNNAFRIPRSFGNKDNAESMLNKLNNPNINQKSR